MSVMDLPCVSVAASLALRTINLQIIHGCQHCLFETCFVNEFSVYIDGSKNIQAIDGRQTFEKA